MRIHAGPFWLFVEALADATLDHLDQLLRATWVECCGHLSAFQIAGRRYQADTGGIDGMWIGMTKREAQFGMILPLERALRPGLKFTYEYDFGSTTELDLEVLAERRASKGGKTIRLLARNDPPEFPCPECDRPPAKTICTECQSDLCEPCGRKHGCDRDSRLPLVNSPRAGVCGYTGKTD